MGTRGEPCRLPQVHLSAIEAGLNYCLMLVPHVSVIGCTIFRKKSLPANIQFRLEDLSKGGDKLQYMLESIKAARSPNAFITLSGGKNKSILRVPSRVCRKNLS